MNPEGRVEEGVRGARRAVDGGRLGLAGVEGAPRCQRRPCPFCHDGRHVLILHARKALQYATPCEGTAIQVELTAVVSQSPSKPFAVVEIRRSLAWNSGVAKHSRVETCDTGRGWSLGVERRGVSHSEMAKAYDVSETTLRMLLAFVDFKYKHLKTLQGWRVCRSTFRRKMWPTDEDCKAPAELGALQSAVGALQSFVCTVYRLDSNGEYIRENKLAISHEMRSILEGA